MASTTSPKTVASDELKPSQAVGELAGLMTKMSTDDADAETTKQRRVYKWKHPIARRMAALKKLEYETIKHEVNYFTDLHALEMKYQQEFAPFEKRRCDIINGVIEPTDSECEWTTDESESDSDKSPPKFNGAESHEDYVPKGIPEFWLTLLLNRSFLVNRIKDHDRPALQCLRNIRVLYTSDGYRLEFIFGDNDYFTDNVLTKDYQVDFYPSTVPGMRLNYNGPSNVGVTGCTINWKGGKNLTTIPESDGSGYKDSFFNFFSRTAAISPTMFDEIARNIIDEEFEFVRLLRQHILPRAIGVYSKKYFCGQFSDFDSSDDDGDDDDEYDADYDLRIE